MPCLSGNVARIAAAAVLLPAIAMAEASESKEAASTTEVEPAEEPPKASHEASHEFCMAGEEFYYVDYGCAPCSECHYCEDGVDGTCGSCGFGYPTMESLTCKKEDPNCDMSKCYFHSSSIYVPDMEGVDPSHEVSPEACQARCANTTGCATFTFEERAESLPKLTGLCKLQTAETEHNWGGTYILSGPAAFPDCCFQVERLVDLLVTFGAPGVSWPAASNPGNECMRGVRMFSENVLPGGAQEDAAAMHTRFPHPKVDVLILRDMTKDYDGSNSSYLDCVSSPMAEEELVERLPLMKGGVVHDWSIHSIAKVYRSRLSNVSLPHTHHISQDTFEKYVDLGVAFATMAHGVYTQTLEGSIELVKKNIPGWRLVGFALVKGSMWDEDAVMLVQSETTKSCAITFEGSNSLADIGSFGADLSGEFCRFNNVHKGVKDELWTIANHHAYQTGIKSKLSKCNRVICVGHSLGGALCDLFTLCANSNHGSNPDYELLAWDKGEQPVLMPELTTWDSQWDKAPSSVQWQTKTSEDKKEESAVASEDQDAAQATADKEAAEASSASSQNAAKEHAAHRLLIDGERKATFGISSASSRALSAEFLGLLAVGFLFLGGVAFLARKQWQRRSLVAGSENQSDSSGTDATDVER